MAKSPRQRNRRRLLPYRKSQLQKRSRKLRKRRSPHPHQLAAPHLRRSQPRTKKPAPRPWFARSPASTASVSRRSPAPDSAAASPSRTSWPSSIASPRRQPLRRPPPLNRHPHPHPLLPAPPLPLPIPVISSP